MLTLASPMSNGSTVYAKDTSFISYSTGIILPPTKVAEKAVSYFKEHTKNARNSTSDKHTKPRPGRETEKKQQKLGFKSKQKKKC
ncbi:hypothetical protein EDD66_11012 [Mobilisporobacter senegalensis]|uniref:Uncharacterized protein n=2 Tax=Mobilisporobacter senegalensis TaxID=1329262 RepID=A0A3N1XKS3_9FIRM|nr:hypothetical protein EDD66_11012 [Mobilisporobacter senegalensis]